MTERRLDALAVASLTVVKGLVMAYAWHRGFHQISDDDYARVVIAQQFAHAPRIDPSGTSWLPLPFWWCGGAMMVLGRSLGVARALAVTLGLLSPAVVFAGLRAMAVSRRVAVVAAGVASLSPWEIWLGLAPVPEGWAGSFAAASLLFLSARRPVLAAALACAASLARYEAWPVAALVCLVALARRDRGSAALAVAGIAGWLVNNRVAHGDAFHFITRVTAYHQAVAGAGPWAARALVYPLALFEDAPDTVLAGVVGLVAVGVSLRRRRVDGRWLLPLLGVGLVLAFLVFGSLRESAPTHHPVRALVAPMTLVTVAALCATARAPVVLALTAAGCLALGAWRLRDVPGNGEEEQRTTQIERGLALATAPHVTVVPCRYEHFALLAAMGAPERATIAPMTRDPVTPACPKVTP